MENAVARKSNRTSTAIRKATTSVDEAIGSQIRRRRLMLGLSQCDLSKIISVTQQQIQKYETGANRLTVARLVEIADALEAPVGWFFKQVDKLEKKEGRSRPVSTSDTASLVLELFQPRHQRKLHAITELLLRNDAARSSHQLRKARRHAS